MRVQHAPIVTHPLGHLKQCRRGILLGSDDPFQCLAEMVNIHGWTCSTHDSFRYHHTLDFEPHDLKRFTGQKIKRSKVQLIAQLQELREERNRSPAPPTPQFGSIYPDPACQGGPVFLGCLLDTGDQRLRQVASGWHHRQCLVH